MRHSPLAVALLLIASASGQSQNDAATPQNPQPTPGPKMLVWTPPDHPVPPFGSQIRKAVDVVRLICATKDKDGKDQTVQLSGTGFIVAYRDPRLQGDLFFDYLVTNRHVAECMDGDMHPMRVLSIALEVNLNNGQTATLSLNEHGNMPWSFPADDSVDLAATPILPLGEFKPNAVPLDSVFSKEDFAAQNIGEGAKIIMSGYFYQLDGLGPKLEPLVREGVLSMIPTAPLKTVLNKPGRVYLGEVHVFGGNSGSPVFISLEGIRPSGITLEGSDYRLLGVVSGYYFEDSDFKLQIATTVTATQHQNSGISLIVPADFLKDLILNNHALASARDANFPQAQAKK